MVIFDTLPGRIRLDNEKLKGNRNLVNKIWNASRYVMMQVEEMSSDEKEKIGKMVSKIGRKLSTSSQDWRKKRSRWLRM